LHTAANLCRELGVSIGAISDGPSTGATFKLRVPYAPPEAGKAAWEPAPILPSSSATTVQFDRRHNFKLGATADVKDR
jgi:hypothetical protein